MIRTNIAEGKVDVAVDDEVQSKEDVQDSRPAIKKFGTTHDTDNIEKVYKDLNVGQYFATKDKLAKTLEVEPEQDDVKEVVQEKRKPMKNPFEAKPIAKKKVTYSDIVNMPSIAPTLEVNSYADMPVKPAKLGMGKRMKLWLITGVCCVVMLASAITLSALDVGKMAGSNANVTEMAVETGELADENGYINNTGEDMNGENMGDMEKVNGDTKPVVKPQTSSSVWDRICAFISSIFGG